MKNITKKIILTCFPEQLKPTMKKGILNPCSVSVPPAETPHHVVRALAGGVEGGGQWDFPLSGSRVIAGKEHPGQIKGMVSTSTLVSLLNQLCKQKPAGGFTLPDLPDTDFCLICSQDGTCIGPSCKGKQEPFVKKSTFISGASIKSIPGLEISGSSSTVLTSRTQTTSPKLAIGSISSRSPLFNPRPRHPDPPNQVTTIHYKYSSLEQNKKPKRSDSPASRGVDKKLLKKMNAKSSKRIYSKSMKMCLQRNLQKTTE